MKYLGVCALVMVMAVPVTAAVSIDVWAGVREVNSPQGPGTFGTTGYTAGGTAGPNQIEAFSRPQTLVLDGTWQQLSFDISATGIAAGGVGSVTGDGLVESNNSVLEHIGFGGNIGGTITVWIDLVENAYDPAGLPPATSVQVSTYDSSYTQGQEVMFQEPSFSGSTGGNISAGSLSGIDNLVGYDDNHSIKAQWKYVDGGANRWLRYTTYGGGAGWQPERNPVIAEADGPVPGGGIPGPQYASSTVTVWMLGFPEPASLTLLAFGGLALLRRR